MKHSIRRSLPISLSKIGKDRFVILLCAGLLLMLIAVPAETVERKLTGTDRASEKSAQAQTEAQQGAAGEDDGLSETERYRRDMEARLESLLGYVAGAGKVKVFVNISQSAEKIVEKDNPNERKTIYETGASGENKNTIELTNDTATVFAEDENGHKVPFVVREKSPVVDGVVVVAQGGGDGEVKNQITEVIQALFGIDTHKIKVVKMKGDGQ